MPSPFNDRNTERLITRYFEDVWNCGNVDVLSELLAPDYVNHSPGLPDPPPGPAGLEPIVRAMREGLPDLHYEILDLIALPDKAAAYVRVTGTHLGAWFGAPPTGRRIDVRQMQIEWVKDGRIWQHWRLTDEAAIARQLAAPAPAAS